MGAIVEVKNQDGIYQEATINKLTDASLYTVGKWGWHIQLEFSVVDISIRVLCLSQR